MTDAIDVAEPSGVVTFSRQVGEVKTSDQWAASIKHFARLHVQRKGSIEDDGLGMLQVSDAVTFATFSFKKNQIQGLI